MLLETSNIQRRRKNAMSETKSSVTGGDRWDLPFPIQQVLFHDQAEATEGDRRRQREGWPAGTGNRPSHDNSYKLPIVTATMMNC
jgi:hypothetical protein